MNGENTEDSFQVSTDESLLQRRRFGEASLKKSLQTRYLKYNRYNYLYNWYAITFFVFVVVVAVQNVNILSTHK